MSHTETKTICLIRALLPAEGLSSDFDLFFLFHPTPHPLSFPFEMWILPLIGYAGVIVGFSFLTLAIGKELYHGPE